MRAIILAALFVSCKPSPVAEDMPCGSASDCPADHRCDIDTLTCIADEVPDLAIDSTPAPDLLTVTPPDMAKCPEAPCRRDQICCNGACISPSDPANCGACGNKCAARYVCCQGLDKGWECSNLEEKDHCGRCGVHCMDYCYLGMCR